MAKRDPKEAEEKRSEICAKSREANWHPERKAGIHHERLFSKTADPFRQDEGLIQDSCLASGGDTGGHRRRYTAAIIVLTTR